VPPCADRSLRRSASLALLVLQACLGSAASFAATATPDAALVAAINRKTLGAPAIRLTTQAGRIQPGDLMATTAGVEFMVRDSAGAPGPTLVPWASVTRIEVRSGHTTGGTLVGMLVGFGASLGLVSSWVRGNDVNLSIESGLGIIAAGTVVGGFVGGVVGSQWKSWARIYPWYERNGVITPH
jgi:hypothetical protein